ncbi:GTPase IMAP family member 3-like [Lissotriton helveticus]
MVAGGGLKVNGGWKRGLAVKVDSGGLQYGSCSGREELRLLIVGSAGAGKSATGNSILGERRFESRSSPTSVTLQCVREDHLWKGRSLVVVDTLGFCNINIPRVVLQRELSRCMELCAPGPHGIVLVLQTGRFSQEEAESVDTIQRVLGKGAEEHMVVVFTRKDDLGQKLIQEFVEESESKLKKLIAKCGGRFCAFDNRATGQENDRQVEELINMVHEIKKQRGHFHIPTEPPEHKSKGLFNRGMALGAGLGLAVGVAVAVGAGTPFVFMVAVMPVASGAVGGVAYYLYKKT